MRFFREHRTLVLLIFFAIVCIAIWFAVYQAERRHEGLLTLAMLDIGQGDSIFIQGPTGMQVLIDGGPNTGAVLRELAEVMPLGDRSINAVVETHPDADHMGGLIDVFDRYSVGAFITPGILKENSTTDALKKEVQEERVPTYVARRGMVIDIGGGAYLEVLYPDADVSHWGEHTNDGSIVMRLVYGSATAMLTGDIGIPQEMHLLAAAPGSLDSDLLKVGHHGSKTSTSQLFLKAVSPSVALISVGKENRYGHPTGEVLARLEQAGVPIMRTDQKGTVVCMTNGASFSCKGEK